MTVSGEMSGEKPVETSFELPFLTGRIRLSGGHTAGAFALLEMNMRADSGPAPHVHLAEDEHFYVLAGSYVFRRGDQTLHCRAGDVVTVPRGVPHTLTAGPEGGRHLTLFQPAGPEGWFVEAHQLAERGLLTPETSGPLFERYGMRQHEL